MSEEKSQGGSASNGVGPQARDPAMILASHATRQSMAAIHAALRPATAAAVASTSSSSSPTMQTRGTPSFIANMANGGMNMLPPSKFSPLAMSPFHQSGLATMLSPGLHALLPPAAATSASPLTRGRSTRGILNTQPSSSAASSSSTGGVDASLTAAIVSPALVSSSSTAVPALPSFDLLAIKASMMDTGTLISEVQKLKKEVAGLEGKLHSALTSVQTHQEQLEQSEQECRVHERAEQHAREELSSIRRQYEQLQTTHSGTLAEFRSLQAQHQSLLQQKEQPSRDVMMINNMLPNQKDYQKALSLEQLSRQRLAAAEKKLQEAEAKYTQLQEKFSSVKSAFKEKEEGWKRLGPTFKQASEKMKEISLKQSREKKELELRVKQLEEEVKEKSERIQELETNPPSAAAALASNVAPAAPTRAPRSSSTNAAAPATATAAQQGKKPRGRPRKIPLPADGPSAEPAAPIDPLHEMVEEQKQAQEDAIKRRAEEILAEQTGVPAPAAAAAASSSVVVGPSTTPAVPSIVASTRPLATVLVPPRLPTGALLAQTLVKRRGRPRKDFQVMDARVIVVEEEKKQEKPKAKRPRKAPSTAAAGEEEGDQPKAKRQKKSAAAALPVDPNAELFGDLFGPGHDDDVEMADASVSVASSAASSTATAAMVQRDTTTETEQQQHLQSIVSRAIGEEWVDRLCDDTGESGEEEQEESFESHPLQRLVPLLCPKLLGNDTGASSSSSPTPHICLSSIPAMLGKIVLSICSSISTVTAQDHVETSLLTLSGRTSQMVRRAAKQMRMGVRGLQDKVTSVTPSEEREKTKEPDQDESMGVTSAPAASSSSASLSSSACSCASSRSSSIDLPSALQQCCYTLLLRPLTKGQDSIENAIVDCLALDVLFDEDQPADATATLSSKQPQLLLRLLLSRCVAPLHLLEHSLVVSKEGETELFDLDNKDLLPLTLHAILHYMLSSLPEEMLTIRAPNLRAFISSVEPTSMETLLNHVLDAIDSTEKLQDEHVGALDLLLTAAGASQAVHIIERVILPRHQAATNDQQRQRWKIIITCVIASYEREAQQPRSAGKKKQK